MRGITRPCRHSLPPHLKERWRAHLCGLCLTLRDEAGQPARLLTGYDTMLPSVLVEAQTGPAETTAAGPCPLRGMRSAQVVARSDAGVRFAAGAGLLTGAAGLDDKVADCDLPGWATPTGTRLAARARRRGGALTAESGFDREPLEAVAGAAAAAERRAGGLGDLLAPSGAAGAALFAHTAVIAGRPANAAALARAGDAFGRLVHLLDAVEDYRRDHDRDAFNPLAATATPPAAARLEAERLVAAVAAALDEVEMDDPDLARALLGPVLARSVEKAFASSAPAMSSPGAADSGPTDSGPTDSGPTDSGPTDPGASDSGASGSGPAGSGFGAAVAALALPAVVAGIFGRPRWGRRRPRYYGDPYGDPYGGYGGPYGGYGYRRRGPSCCDLLACDCCANMACGDCCGGGSDDCCVCCV